MQTICYFIENTAPHGAGINGEYENIHVTNGSTTRHILLFENTYSIMSENGFYEDDVPFRVSISDHDIHVNFLNCHQGRRKYLVYEKYADIKDYLEQVYMEWILDYRLHFQTMIYNKKRLFPQFSL